MILGITGAFGCGKSAVLSHFAAWGWQTADADQLCHEFYQERDPSFLSALTGRWGKQVLDATGGVNRRALGKIVFSDPGELAELTRLIYPRLGEKLRTLTGSWKERELNGAVEVPLLYEERYESWFDATVAVWAAKEVRHARLTAARGFTAAEIRQREDRQLASDVKLERADYALINNTSREELERQIDLLISQLQLR